MLIAQNKYDCDQMCLVIIVGIHLLVKHAHTADGGKILKRQRFETLPVYKNCLLMWSYIISGRKRPKNRWRLNICIRRRLPSACVDTSCDSDTSTLETYYLNYIALQLYAQTCLKYRKSQYWPTVYPLLVIDVVGLHESTVVTKTIPGV